MSRRPLERSGRTTVHELDPELRDRLLSLDEPVAQPDWGDVLSRTAQRSSRQRRVVRTALVAATLCAAAVAVAPAMGIRVGKLVGFWSSPAAPKSAQSTFGRDVLWTRGLPKGLELENTKQVAVERFRGENMRLFVAPLTRGGFCYEWSLKPGTANVWIDEQGGCSIPSEPVSTSFDDTRVSIVANPKLVDAVTVKLSNGRVVQPRLRWVSAPVNAGFLLYQPPIGVYVNSVTALRDGDVVEVYPILQQQLVPQLR